MYEDATRGMMKKLAFYEGYWEKSFASINASIKDAILAVINRYANAKSFFKTNKAKAKLLAAKIEKTSVVAEIVQIINEERDEQRELINHAGDYAMVISFILWQLDTFENFYDPNLQLSINAVQENQQRILS